MKEGIKWQETGKQKDPFQVPEGYFEGFEVRMMERIEEESVSKKRTVFRSRMVGWVSGIAAALLIGFIGFQQIQQKSDNQSLDQDAMFAVVEYFAQDMDELSFASFLAENEVLSTETLPADDDLLHFMNVDDLSLIEVLLNGR